MTNVTSYSFDYLGNSNTKTNLNQNFKTIPQGGYVNNPCPPNLSYLKDSCCQISIPPEKVTEWTKRIMDDLKNGNNKVQSVKVEVFPSTIGDKLDDFISSYIKKLLNKDSTGSSPCEFIETDSFAEVVEKLCILHTRMWYLEDQISYAKNNDEIASLKSRIDQCFKVKRPKLVAALNKLIEGAVLHGKSLNEQSVKLYKGFDSGQNSK